MTLQEHFNALFEQIKHGDEEHQKWLYDKMQEYQSSLPLKEVVEDKGEWVSKDEYEHAVNKIGQLQAEISQANKYIRELLHQINDYD